ncbi:unnamed protein product [Pieris macdunnoughi]|uniref:Uncharacterized protein n=1 Tax=Pieris macdunnoughi TaxID=345717 RepID=A0A821P6W9_9NEOP|nr:unnamed protein product [Pieris macdunnoughi]
MGRVYVSWDRWDGHKLDMERARQEKISTNYRVVLNPQLPVPNRNIPIPVINIIQANKQGANAPIIRSTPSALSPLSLSIGQYSLPCSPNYSPVGSPMKVQSTPQSLSPASSYTFSPGRLVSPTGALQGYDPYLSNKMQVSPGFSMQNEMLLDPNVSLASNDFWPDTDVIQNTSDLLTAFDDVKLV